MFGLFGKSPDYILPEVTPLKMPSVKPPAVNNDGYTVGVDNSGLTVLKMTTGYNTTTLTMNEFGTRQMIKLLIATLPGEEDNA